MNMHEPKNNMTTMMWDMQMERAFFLPSVLWFHRECKMTMYEIIRITKLFEQMTSLLDTNSRWSHKYTCMQVSIRAAYHSNNDQIGSTERQSQGQDILSHRMYKRPNPCKSNKDDAEVMLSHYGGVMQGLTDGHIVSNGNEHEDK